jgi:hypothetical protein
MEARGKEPLDIEKFRIHLLKETFSVLPIGNGHVYALQAATAGLYIDTVNGGQVLLQAGDVWKYGTHYGGSPRYSGTQLSGGLAGNALTYSPVFTGNNLMLRLGESILLGGYHVGHGRLPPGNAREWD